MTASPDIFPGSIPARGTVRPLDAVSTQRGANAGMGFHRRGDILMTAWCGNETGVELWSVLQPRSLGRMAVELELGESPAALEVPLWPASSEPQPQGFPGHLHAVYSFAVAERSDHVVVSSGRGARAYTVAPDGTQLIRASGFRAGDAAIARVDVTAVGDRTLGADGLGGVYVWSMTTGQQQHGFRISRPCTAAKFIWNDMLAMVGDDLGRVIAWELEGGRRHLQFQAHRAPVTAVRFSAENALLLTCGADLSARVWHLEHGRQVGRDLSHRAAVHDACFARAGRFVVTACADGHVAIWNAADGALLDWFFEGTPVLRVAVHEPTGRLAIAGPRSIRTVAIDWAKLEQIAASPDLPVPPTSFIQPPSRAPVSHQGAGGAEAPIGATFAPRATGDLPIPDRSNLAMARQARAPATQAMAAIVGPDPRTQMDPRLAQGRGADPRFAPDARKAADPRLAQDPRFGAPPPAPGRVGGEPRVVNGRQRMATGAIPAIPTTAEPPVPRGSIESLRPEDAAAAEQAVDDFFATAFQNPIGTGVTPPPGSVPANLLGGPSTPGPARAIATYAESGTASPEQQERALAGANHAPGAALVSPVVAATPARVQRVTSGGDAIRMAVLQAVLVALVLSFGGRVGLVWYYSTQAYPTSVAAAANTLETAHRAQVAEETDALSAFRDEMDARRAEYASAPSFGASERERLIGRTERQLEEREAQAAERVQALEQSYAAELLGLEHDREIAATRTGNFGAGILLLLALGVGVPLAVRRNRRR